MAMADLTNDDTNVLVLNIFVKITNMGSGKGKTRRVQANMQEFSDILATNMGVWKKWAVQAGIEKTSLGEYYLNIDSLHQENMTEAQAEFIIGEVLADAVNCEAIQLPTDPQSGSVVAIPNDFKIKVEIGNYSEWFLAILHKATGKEGIAYDLILEPHQNMISEGRYIIAQIHDAIEDSRYHISP